MHTGKGQVIELILQNGHRHARISCPTNLIPSSGQYLLSGLVSSSDLLPVPLFSTESTPWGFTACAPIPQTWTPGTSIYLRGPLGHGFELPTSAKKVALVPFWVPPSCLKSLIPPALKQGAGVVLVCNSPEERLPDDVEIQPVSAIGDVLMWADYTAFEVFRESLPEFGEWLGSKNQVLVKNETQVLVHTPIPCGGVAECGVCATMTKSSWKLACKDGPVFELREII